MEIGPNRPYLPLESRRVIEYELYDSEPAIFAIENYDPARYLHTGLGFQKHKLQRVCQLAGERGRQLVDNARTYDEKLKNAYIRQPESLSAARWRSAQTLTDALSRAVGISNAVEVMLERDPEGEHNLLEVVMSLYVHPSSNGVTRLDTGNLPYGEYVQANQQAWQDICVSTYERFS